MRMFGRYSPAYLALIALVVIEVILASIAGRTYLGLDPSDFLRLGDMRLRLAGWLLVPMLWLGSAAVHLALRRIDRPTAKMLRLIRISRTWLIRGAILTAMLLPITRAFGTMKSSISRIVPFYGDKYLIELDAMLFGQDPWKLSHAIIGDMGTVIIDRAYFLWFMCLVLLIGWINFSRDQRFQIRGALAFNLVWLLLGSVMAISFSSVGPCFYEHFSGNPRFSGLMADLERIDAEHRLFAIGAMKFLLRSHGEFRLGAGISAMPSLHVAIAFLGFLATLTLKRMHWIKVVAGVFALVILVGSVHLGWHYAVDGLASIIGTWLIWFGAGRFVDWVERRADAKALTAPANAPLASA